MTDGFFRVAAATPKIKVADCSYNKEQIVSLLRQAAERQAGAVVFPELCLTGYTCGDLFHDSTLIRASERALLQILEETQDLNLIAAIGLPVALHAELYNAAAVICRGELLGFAAKSNIPNYGEFYEARHFSPAPKCLAVEYAGRKVPLGSQLVFLCENEPMLAIGAEICEDLWVASPPSTVQALSGATVLLNSSASDEVIGKAAYRRSLVQGQSARLISAYVYADAGAGESSTDLVFSGHNIIAENGTALAESEPFGTGLVTADIDLERLAQERRRTTTWRPEYSCYEVPFRMNLPDLKQERRIAPMPFVPEDSRDLAERCEMILNMQANGLKTRLEHTKCKSAVIGISGGLDSTLALLVTVRAFDFLQLDRGGICAVSMPGFGTTERTKSNAQLLAELLGVTYREIPIGETVMKHFRDIGHDPEVRDVTYENAQARERTQVLMDIANQTGGMVIGTGDLSELALGWATYNGDHMSMYGVNASIPKTLVRHLVNHAAVTGSGNLCALLKDILDTPVSPELLPPVDGLIFQETETIVGPYELHDFFLYYLLRFGFSPGKIYRMACSAFAGKQEPEEILRWLKIFYRRFFAQQFKRSCLPDGPKVGSVTLSPRGDWRMPSDASAAVWTEELEQL